MKKILTTSSGSIPAEVDHANCERLVRTDFYLHEVPQTVKQHPSRIWGEGEGEGEIKYATESDLVSFVRIFLRDIISAMGLGLDLISDLSIKHVAPDICVVANGERLVGVIEVKKKCGTNNILIQPTVLGELLDQMLLVEGFYRSGPVIGILTTFEEWMFAWFVADDKHFTCETNSGTAAEEETDSAQDSPPGDTPSRLSAEYHFIGEEVEDEDEDEEEEEGLAGELQLYGDRTLTTTQVFNSKEDFEVLLEHVYTAFRRMSEVRIHHKLGVPRCLFQLRSDRVGITWHAIDRIPIDLMNLSSINSSPRDSVKHLLAVEDLGRGSSGKVWLTCTVSNKPSICVS